MLLDPQKTSEPQTAGGETMEWHNVVGQMNMNSDKTINEHCCCHIWLFIVRSKSTLMSLKPLVVCSQSLIMTL